MVSDEWFVTREGRRLGPYTFATVRELAARGKLRPDDSLWTEGLPPGGRRADAIVEIWMHARIEPQPAAQEVQGPAPAQNTAAPLPEAPAEDANYLVRHWRGALSLPVSYWVNGVLLTVALSITFKAVAAADFLWRLGTIAVGWWMLGVVVVVSGCTTWQLVGIWRSANRHRARGGSSGWATAAKVMVVLNTLRSIGFAAQGIPVVEQGFRMAWGTDRTPATQFRVVNHGKELEVGGGIKFGATDALQKLLDANPTVRVVQLNNAGGYIREADRMGRLISDRGLTTFTARECVSACLLAFLGGKERLLGSKAKLGFHEASIAGVGGNTTSRFNEEFRSAFLRRGLPGDFVERALATNASAMWYPTPDELRQAHVITGIVNESDFGTTGVKHWNNRALLEADLATIPLFAALRRAEPVAYADIKEIYLNGIQEGWPQGEIRARVRSALADKIIPKYLRTGPDRELVAYWRSQLSVMRELRATEPKDCTAFLFATKDTDFGRMAGHISADTSKSESHSLTQLLDETALEPAAAPSEPAVRPALQTVRARVQLSAPWAWQLVANPRDASATPAKLCDAELTFFDTVLSLPPNEAGPVLRYLATRS
jgi:hypothetical protein